MPSVTVLFCFLRVRVELAAAIIYNPNCYRLIGRRGPLRVRAFVLVRCPRSGKPRR